MKIGTTTKVSSSSHGEMTINTMEKRKMNSSSPESTYSSIISEHRNDDNEVNFLDDTVDEWDTNSPTLSFETAATDNVERGGCGLFIHQVSNRFDTDRSSDRSTVISDMVDNIEEELHERFFARRYSDDESSVDTLNEDTQDTFEDDGQDVTVDSNMPSVTSTTVSSKISTIRQSKSLDTTDGTRERKQSIKVKEEGPQDTFVSVEEDVEESQAKNGSWFGEFFSSNVIVNVDESIKEEEKEVELIDPSIQANEYKEQQPSAKDILSRVKEVSALVAEVFNLPLSIVDEEKTTADQEKKKSIVVQDEESTLVVKDIFAVESSSTIDSIELSVFSTMVNGTEENKAQLSDALAGTKPSLAPVSEEKVSKQKKRLLKIPKKVRSISRRLFAITKTA